MHDFSPDARQEISTDSVKSAPKKHSYLKTGLKWLGYPLLGLIIIGFLLPGKTMIPVNGATTNDWNHQTFWHHPWGRSGVHKGIDIFGRKGKPIVAATSGWVIAAENLRQGGKTISILGPKWRVHYYAHLESRQVKAFQWVQQGQVIGSLGDSGNAKGKAPHLHYTIATLFPYPWRVNRKPQGWKRMFFLNPDKFLR